MEVLKMIVDFYFIFLFIFFGLSFVLRDKKVFAYTFVFGIVIGMWALSNFLELQMCEWLFSKKGLNLMFYLPFVYIVLIAKELGRYLDTMKVQDIRANRANASSESSKLAIIDSVFYLAERKIGAIITLEKHNSLDQFAEKAIQMNCDISKEVIINIFEPNTPLHDGAVIIRGDKIRCAGAYYVLTQTDASDKTMGSRHRAALGISEMTDSLTIVCSEETGNVSIAAEGIMLRVNDREKLIEYIEMFAK